MFGKLWFMSFCMATASHRHSLTSADFKIILNKMVNGLIPSGPIRKYLIFQHVSNSRHVHIGYVVRVYIIYYVSERRN